MAVIYSLHPTNDCTTLQAHRQCQYPLPICLLWALILFFSSLRNKFFKFPGKVNLDLQLVSLGGCVGQADSIS